MRVLKIMACSLLLLGMVALAEEPEDRPSDETIEGWIADLTHPDLTRREAATSNLIAAGDVAAYRLWSQCDAADQGLALRARRVFGAVFGVSPEIYGEIKELVQSSTPTGADLAARAQQVMDHGPAAVDLALRLLGPERKRRLVPLYTELVVRAALDDLADGNDMHATGHNAVVELSDQAAPALLRVLEDREGHSAHRIHALWLYSTVTGAGGVEGLARVLDDSDPVVREEALLAAVELIDNSAFSRLARAVGSRASTERTVLANAAAARLTIEDLEKHLRSGTDAVAALSATVLGYKRHDDALSALVGRVEREKRVNVLEAICSGLAEYGDAKGIEALGTIYTKNRSASVRAAAIAGLRNHAADMREARLCVTASLLDDDEGVRLGGVDVLIGLADRTAVPALVAAAAYDTSHLVRSRALAGLRSVVPDGPVPKASGEEALTELARRWKKWLVREVETFDTDSFPWLNDALDAVRIVKDVREHVADRFFYFDNEELVDDDTLNAAALGAMKKVFKGKDPVKVEGLDRQILESMLRPKKEMTPEAVLACLGACPFETEVSDLIRITNTTASGMIKSLGDRFSGLRLSNDPEGNVRPGWLPGLLDNSDESNGFMVSEKDDTIVVDFVLYDSPAYYAGIRPGDQLIQIDDEFVSELQKEDRSEKLLKKGKFSFLRDGWNRPYSFELVPTKVMAQHIVIKALLPGKIGYLRLKMFDLGCSVKMEHALKELEKEGIEGLIFDLRNNPGGTVADATEIVDKFLPKGKTISINVTRGYGDKRHEEVETEVLSTDALTDRDYPLVVLVNRSSASASEMTSGSLQGTERGKVIGETTFGKGIGQNGRTISGFSSDTALGETRSVYIVQLTMMRYYLPEGKRSIHHIGVEPDVPVLERNLRGSAFDKVMKARRSKAFDGYVSDLIENHREDVIELAVFDGWDFDRYPGFAKFYSKVKRWVSQQEARRLVRDEIRLRVIKDADNALFEKLSYDIQEDRVLLAGVRELNTEESIDVSGCDEYRKL